MRTGVCVVRGTLIRGIAVLADVANRQCRHGRPERVIRCKHPVIAMPVLAWRRDEIREPVEELERRKFHDPARSRPSGPRITESRSSARGGRAEYRSRCSRATLKTIAIRAFFLAADPYKPRGASPGTAGVNPTQSPTPQRAAPQPARNL